MLKIVKKPSTAETAVAGAQAGTNQISSIAKVSEGATVMGMMPMATVHLQVKYSHKLPSDDWISVEIGLDLPCKHDEIDKMHLYAKDWTDAKLNAAVEEITSAA